MSAKAPVRATCPLNRLAPEHDVPFASKPAGMAVSMNPLDWRTMQRSELILACAGAASPRSLC